MYYVAKFLQAAGLGTILTAFLLKFPNVMDRNILALGCILFICGWILQNYGLKK